MIPNVDPRQMKRMMAQMGIKSEELEASEVVIKMSDGEIVITSPQVIKVEMQGQSSFQISGKVEKRSGVREEDVKLVMEQTGATREKAEEALKEAKGDLAEAILQLKG